VIELASLAALALVAGVVSFTAPCTLPLLPGYVSYVSGLSEGPRGRGAALGPWLFVAGFSITFTALGATASAFGFLMATNARVVETVAGTIIAAMGLVLLGALRAPWLRREWRLPLHRVARGPAGAAPLGIAFALGWTPCIGPVLAGILATAATRTSVGQGAFLLFVYAVGLGAPFLWLARQVRLGRDRLGWFRRNARRLELIGGAVLVAMGIAVASGVWTVLMSRMLAWYARFGWPPI
jgi:cytochrome c-type biogenesis protein